MLEGKCLFFTGLPCSGKTTIAKELLKYFPNSTLLDGDIVRGTPLANKAGFSVQGRREHIKRMGHIAKLVTEANGIAICTFVSPENEARDYVRSLFKSEDFYEIYISTPLEECEKRDVKGMYVKARAGEIKDFTGISAPYEAPLNPEMVMDTTHMSLDESVQKIIGELNVYPERACFFIGRWNGTFHKGHEYIIQKKLDEGKNVIMAVRDVKPDEKNPWTAKEVKEMLDYFWANDNRVRVIVIPDVWSVEYGRGVGYEINEIKVDKEIAGISGTRCREMIANGEDGWREYLPPRIVEFLEKKMAY